MCLDQTENCFRLNPRAFANNNVKFQSFCHNFRLSLVDNKQYEKKNKNRQK